MTDKQKIKEEIERLINDKTDGKHVSKADIIAPKRCAYLDILNFINSLPEEPASEDLEEAADKYAENHGFRVPYDGSNKFYDDVDVKASKESFIAGAEWQKQKDQETIELAEDHAMLAGMNRMKEEMMENAVEGRVQCGYGDGNKLSIKAMLPQDSDLKYADKVKVLILKTE